MKTFLILKIGRKPTLLLGMFTFQILCLAALGLWSIDTLDESSDRAMEESAANTNAADAGNHLNSVAAHVAMLTLSPTFSPEITERIVTLRKEYTEHLASLRKTAHDPESARLAQSVIRAVEQFQDNNMRVIERAKAGKQAEAQALYRTKTIPFFQTIDSELEKFVRLREKAPDDIKSKINGVQSSTSTGIAGIGRIPKVIQEVSEIVSSIATAIEEQATVTKDIAQSIAQASAGVEDANGRVAETSHASQDIAKEIAGVDRPAREIADGSEHVRASATELSALSEKPKAAAARFAC